MFAVLDDAVAPAMTRAAEDAASEGDSIGGILETAVIGVPAGVGEPWFDSMESTLSHALFSIPAVKGVEFGCGFSFADMKCGKMPCLFYHIFSHLSYAVSIILQSSKKVVKDKRL